MDAHKTLFYLLVKKDGSSKLPAVDAVFDDTTLPAPAAAPAAAAERTHQPGSATSVQPTGSTAQSGAASSAPAASLPTAIAPTATASASPAAAAALPMAATPFASMAAGHPPSQSDPGAQQSAALPTHLSADSSTQHQQPQLQTRADSEHQHSTGAHQQASFSSAEPMQIEAGAIHPDKLVHQRWCSGSQLGVNQHVPVMDSGVIAGPSQPLPTAKQETAQVAEGVPVQPDLSQQLSPSAPLSLHVNAPPVGLLLPASRAEVTASDKETPFLMTESTAEVASTAKATSLPGLDALKNQESAAGGVVKPQQTGGLIQVATQGHLQGVLGAACSQIIAKQQARSPTAAWQSSQQLLSPPHPLHQHHLQQDPSQFMLQPQTQPGMNGVVPQPHEHLPQPHPSDADADTNQEQHANPPASCEAVQRLVLQLPEEMDSAWVSMLIHQPEHAQTVPTYLPQHAQDEAQTHHQPASQPAILQGKPVQAEAEQPKCDQEQLDVGMHHAATCSSEVLPGAPPQTDSTTTEDVDIMAPQLPDALLTSSALLSATAQDVQHSMIEEVQLDVDVHDAQGGSDEVLQASLQSESVTTEDVDITGPQMPGALLEGAVLPNLAAQVVQHDMAQDQLPQFITHQQQQLQHPLLVSLPLSKLDAGLNEALSRVQQLEQHVLQAEASTQAWAPAAHLPTDQLQQKFFADAVMEEQQRMHGLPTEAALDGGTETAEQPSEQPQVQQPSVGSLIASDQHMAEPAEVGSDTQLMKPASAPDNPAPESQADEHPIDKLERAAPDRTAAAATAALAADVHVMNAPVTAADMSSERPRTRLRRSLQAASSTAASMHAMSPPKAASEPAPQAKPQSPSVSKSKSKTKLAPVRRPSVHSLPAKAKQAKQDYQPGSVQQERAAQAAHASKKQPQLLAQQPPDSGLTAKAVTKGKRSPKRKHSDMLSGQQHLDKVMLQGSAASKGTSTSAEKKTVSSSRYLACIDCMSPEMALPVDTPGVGWLTKFLCS